MVQQLATNFHNILMVNINTIETVCTGTLFWSIMMTFTSILYAFAVFFSTCTMLNYYQ